MKPDGGPAYPISHQDIDLNGEFVKIGHSGMTLRDWFAGQALGGQAHDNGKLGDPTYWHWDEIAHVCYLAADAMIAERMKGGKE
jgi:hypothetical protein